MDKAAVLIHDDVITPTLSSQCIIPESRCIRPSFKSTSSSNEQNQMVEIPTLNSHEMHAFTLHPATDNQSNHIEPMSELSQTTTIELSLSLTRQI